MNSEVIEILEILLFNYPHKMHCYSQFFWIPVAFAKICFSHMVINYTNINASVLGETVLKFNSKHRN